MTKRAERDESSEIADLQQRLQEAEDTLEAIRSGTVDALVVEGENQQQIFTLKSADHTYRMLIESMSQGALTITQNGLILYSNTQFSRLVGVPLERIIGTSIRSHVAKQDRSRIDALISNTEGGEVTVAINGKASTKHASEPKTVLVSATKLPAEDSIAHMCLVITDITERKRAEDIKDEFISLASHQLRTPATGVKQYLGMVLEGYAGNISAKNRVFIKTAYDSNERELHIINALLKTAQLDSGLFELSKAQHRLLPIIGRIVVDFAPIFTIRRQKVTVTGDPDVSAAFDASEMEVAFVNIIENASKYSPEDREIAINIYEKGDKAYLSVVDHGVGIDAADRQRIFEKFTRINNAVSDTVSGSGLGLYWVKRIIEMHGGSVDITSTTEGGSTFTVILPT